MGSLLQGDVEKDKFSISIAPIVCPFPCRLHPDAVEMIEMSDAWLVDGGKRTTAACRSEAAAKLFAPAHLVGSTYGFLVSLYFANAISIQRLVPVLKLMNWYFLIDTCVDEPGMLGDEDGVDATRMIVQSVMAVFDPPTPPAGKPTSLPHASNLLTASICSVEDVHPQHAVRAEPALHDAASAPCDARRAHIDTRELAHIFTSSAAEWWSDMCVDMPLSLQARFREAIGSYLSCNLRETSFRSAHHLPDVPTYLHIRSQSIGWHPLAVLTEYTLYMELDQEAVVNPLVLALKQSVCESIILVNDVISFGKEYNHRDHFNIIMVLCYQKLMQGQCEHALVLNKSWPSLATPEMVQDSMNEALEIIKERNQACVCMIEKIKGSPLLMEKPGMGSFLDAMGNFVAGTIYWHLTSERFGISTNNNDKTPHEILNGVDILASYTLHLDQIKI